MCVVCWLCVVCVVCWMLCVGCVGEAQTLHGLASACSPRFFMTSIQLTVRQRAAHCWLGPGGQPGLSPTCVLYAWECNSVYRERAAGCLHAGVHLGPPCTALVFYHPTTLHTKHSPGVALEGGTVNEGLSHGVSAAQLLKLNANLNKKEGLKKVRLGI